MNPRTGTFCPYIHDELHRVAVIQRADFDDHHFRRLFALAIDWRAAVGTEVSIKLVATLCGIGINLRCARGESDGTCGNDGVVAHAAAGSFLAVDAVACNDVLHRLIHRVANFSAQASALNFV